MIIKAEKCPARLRILGSSTWVLLHDPQQYPHLFLCWWYYVYLSMKRPISYSIDYEKPETQIWTLWEWFIAMISRDQDYLK